jgi:hypothetical protein
MPLQWLRNHKRKLQEERTTMIKLLAHADLALYQA